MTIPQGSRLGPYEILSPLGAGGMGEVYKARDTRLGRTVAIKILPAEVSSSPDFRQRFEREARTIAQVSHPNICALHDVGREGETEYLVMELLEGETLSNRLARGASSLSETLRWGMQIASGLDAAHRKGIVHRDLKPANVMLTRSGVKLLDFGLAKILAPVSTIESLTAAETAAPEVTRPGIVLGTVPYMSPEQLEGKETDARSDIFALGAVLYEMATGRKAFTGASPVSIMSAILTSEPPSVTSLAPASPPSLDRLIRTCLAKAPDDRWQTARDVELQLAAIREGVSAPEAKLPAVWVARARWPPWLVAGIAVAVATASFLRRGSAPPNPPPRSIRFLVPPPKNAIFNSWVERASVAISPDGSELAYLVSESGGPRRIYVRPLSATEGRPVAGTEGAGSVFYSPDGRSLGFFADGKLKRIDRSGGAAVSICDVFTGGGVMGSWGRKGDILLALVPAAEIQRVPAAGGVPTTVLRADPARGEARVAWPWFLPDGERFLYLAWTPSGAEGRLMLAAPGREPQLITRMESEAQYSEPGYLVFAREGALVAAPFDSVAGRLTGGPRPIAEHVRYFLSTGWAGFATSAGGTLAYQSEPDRHRLAWFDRQGREIGTVGSPGQYLTVTLSADGRRLLFDRTRPDTGTYDVWSLDLERGVEHRITSEVSSEFAPLFLPDGRNIVYSKPAGTAPQLFRHDLATGKEEELAHTGRFQIGLSLAPGGLLLFSQRGERGWDLWTLSPSAGGKPAMVPRSTLLNSDQARLSPDGRALAMLSEESGRLELYVTSYPEPGERGRVSAGGARKLRWSRDGRELFFLSVDGRMMSAPVRTTSPLQVGTPAVLFAVPGKGRWQDFDLSPDGQKFLAIVSELVGDELPLTVVTNWTSEIAGPR